MFVWVHIYVCVNGQKLGKATSLRSSLWVLCTEARGHKKTQGEGISRTMGMFGLPMRAMCMSRWDEMCG